MHERPQRPGEELPDNCKLFVAGMPPGFDDETLRAVFSPFGPVLHAAVIKDQVTGLPKYGFVHFPDASSALAAADGMNGKVICEDDGARPLTVKLRSDRHQAAPGTLQHSFDEAKLYVAHLPDSATEEQLRGLFGSVAPVLQVFVPSCLLGCDPYYSGNFSRRFDRLRPLQFMQPLWPLRSGMVPMIQEFFALAFSSVCYKVLQRGRTM